MSVDLNSLKSVLDKGESVEWAAVAEPFPTVDRYNRKSLQLRCIVTIVIAAALAAAYVIAAHRQEGLQVQPLLPAIIAVVAVFIIIRPYLDAGTIRKKRIYAVTGKRILIRESESGVKSMPLDSIEEAVFIDKGAGIGDVLFGSAVKKPYHKIRNITLMPIEGSGEGEGVTGMVFYNVRNTEKIKPLLSKKTAVTDRCLEEAL